MPAHRPSANRPIGEGRVREGDPALPFGLVHKSPGIGVWPSRGGGRGRESVSSSFSNCRRERRKKSRGGATRDTGRESPMNATPEARATTDPGRPLTAEEVYKVPPQSNAMASSQ